MAYVHGKAVDGSIVTVYVEGSTFKATKVSGKDGLAKSGVNVLGEQETRAWTYGKYNPEATDLEMLHQDVYDLTQGLLSILPANGYGNTPLEVVVRTQDYDLNPATAMSPALLELQACFITAMSDAYENTESQTVVTVQIQPSQLLRNGKSINRRRGVPG